MTERAAVQNVRSGFFLRGKTGWVFHTIFRGGGK